MQQLKRVAQFLTRDHTYVFLGTSALALVGIYCMTYLRSPWSFLNFALAQAVYFWLCAWVVLSVVALINKLVQWNSYAKKSLFVKPQVKRILRYLSYVTWALVLIALLDGPIFGLAYKIDVVTSLSSAPDDKFDAGLYVLFAAKNLFGAGILTTIELAVFGTLIAFVFAVLMCFLRILHPQPSDNDFIKFIKIVASGFTKVYSAVIRGTPMMVQGLIIYFFGFGLFKGSGMSATEIGQIWSFFVAGLVTISLNSTAYMMEVLRGGIEAVDAGQTEAARSLGMSQWQAMMKVVFPQGIKNAIPALSNELVINIKDSSVLSVIGVFDLMYATTTAAGIYFRQMEIYMVAAVLYLILTMTATRLLNIISKKLDVNAQTLPSSN